MTTDATTRAGLVTFLDIGGMSCGACSARIEKVLNRFDGVVAEVNFATEQARVLHPAEVDLAELVAAVEKAGYTAAPRRDTEPEPEPQRPTVDDDPEQRSLR